MRKNSRNPIPVNGPLGEMDVPQSIKFSDHFLGTLEAAHRFGVSLKSRVQLFRAGLAVYRSWIIIESFGAIVETKSMPFTKMMVRRVRDKTRVNLREVIIEYKRHVGNVMVHDPDFDPDDPGRHLSLPRTPEDDPRIS
jgi:hypothetical protein